MILRPFACIKPPHHSFYYQRDYSSRMQLGTSEPTPGFHGVDERGMSVVTSHVGGMARTSCMMVFTAVAHFAWLGVVSHDLHQR